MCKAARALYAVEPAQKRKLENFKMQCCRNMLKKNGPIKLKERSLKRAGEERCVGKACEKKDRPMGYVINHIG